jgi:NADH dehydrogenase
MSATHVAVLGGSGFVGRSLVARLCAEGRHVKVLTRDPLSAHALLVLPTVEVVRADPHDDRTLPGHLEGMDAVVNLVAILHEKGKATFQAVNVDLPRKVAGACRASCVPRLVHMSALGASESAPSGYLRSRGRGEAAVREAAGNTALTFFRPSVIFGPDDSFLNLFARLAGLFPVIPLAGPDARFQPVWVEDVTRCVALALDDARTFGATYELGGPKTYTLAEILAFVIALRGGGRMVLGLPGWAAQLQAMVFEHLPGPIMTRDNLASMSVPNVCAGPFPEVFGFQPASMEAIVPGYLAAAGQKARYDGFRCRAGR